MSPLMSRGLSGLSYLSDLVLISRILICTVVMVCLSSLVWILRQNFNKETHMNSTVAHWRTVLSHVCEEHSTEIELETLLRMKEMLR